MHNNSFYSKIELSQLGLKSYGENVLISKKCSLYSPELISIGDNVRIDDFCILSGKITIKNYIHIAAYSALYGSDIGIEINDFANISSRNCIYSVSDDYSGDSMTNPMIPDKFKKLNKGKVVIDKHVIIGSNSLIMPGVTLNEGCAVGAFSFVNNDCEAWTINAGVPCKIIKKRSKSLLKLEKEFTSIKGL